MIEMVVDTALFEQRTEAVKTETRGVVGELIDRIKGAQMFSVAETQRVVGELMDRIKEAQMFSAADTLAADDVIVNDRLKE